MTAYLGQPRTMLGQLCAPLWESQSQPDVIQPGFEPGTVVTPLAPRCSALDRYVHVCNYLTVLECLKDRNFFLNIIIIFLARHSAFRKYSHPLVESK